MAMALLAVMMASFVAELDRSSESRQSDSRIAWWQRGPTRILEHQKAAEFIRSIRGLQHLSF